MKAQIKFKALSLTILLLTSLLPVVAQEALSESYYQAAIEALDKGDYHDVVRFAKLGLAEAEKLRSSNPKVAERQAIRGLNLQSGALIELKDYPEAEKVKREEIELLERVRSQDYPEYSTNYPMSLESLGFILTEQNKGEEANNYIRNARNDGWRFLSRRELPGGAEFELEGRLNNVPVRSLVRVYVTNRRVYFVSSSTQNLTGPNASILPRFFKSFTLTDYQ